MIKEIEQMHKLASAWLTLTFSVQTIFFLEVTEWGEGQTSATCLTPLEHSDQSNITCIQTNMLIWGAGRVRMWMDRGAFSKYWIKTHRESSQERGSKQT